MSSLVLCLALEGICALSSSSQLVLVFLAHSSFPASWHPQLPTFGPTSIYSRALVVSTRFVYAITPKKTILPFVPVEVVRSPLSTVTQHNNAHSTPCMHTAGMHSKVISRMHRAQLQGW